MSLVISHSRRWLTILGFSFFSLSQNATNYPIVRLQDPSGKIYFARTFNWSGTSVATGSTPVSVQFTLPPGISGGSGNYLLSVIANGISSTAVSFTP